MEHELAEVFRAIFELPEDADVHGLRQLTFPQWDSLAHVTLISAVENQFEREIDIEQSLELTSFEAILIFLEDERS